MRNYEVRVILGTSSAAFDLNSRFLRLAERPDPHVHAEQLLTTLLNATESEHGFISIVEGQGHTEVASLLTIPNLASRIHAAAKNDLDSHRPFYAHSAAEMPSSTGTNDDADNVDTLCFLPVRIADQLVAIVGLANRPGGFDGREHVLLGPLLHQIALGVHFIGRASRPDASRLDAAELAVAAQRNNWYQHRAVWASMAHDLNGAFAAVSLQCQLLRHGASPELERSLNRITEAIDRLSNFGLHLEVLGRLQESRSTTSLLMEVLNTVKFLVRDMFPLPNWFDVASSCATETTLDFPDNHLLMVVFALVANSVEASDGRDLRVLITVREEDHDLIAIDVTDNGPGIDASVLPFLLDRPVSTKGGSRGTGLLAVDHLVKQHGGTVSISTGNLGTCITVRLPVVVPPHV